MNLQGEDYSSEFEKYQKKTFRIGKKSIDFVKIKDTLLNHFGYKEFKSVEQGLVTLKALNRESLFAVLATGSGKSTAFLLPAFLRQKIGFTLVVSPLKALMDQFTSKLSWVETIHGDVPEKWKVWRDIERGKVHLLQVAPETLRNPNFRKQLIKSIRKSDRKLDCFVLDEVHCVSDWGHEFRPEYWWVAEYLIDLEKKARVEWLPRVMLTATANEYVQEEVLSLFGFKGKRRLIEENIIRGSAARPEIFLASAFCRTPNGKFKLARKFLNRQANRPLPYGVKRRVLLYTQEAVGHEEDDIDIADLKKERRLKANEIAKVLKACSTKNCKISARTFSSRGMDAEGKNKTTKFFENAQSKAGQVRVIVATSAFGMGMDYNRIPGLIHFYPRTSLSEYWQQVGRSGRGFSLEDGEWAEALALHCKGDITQAYYQANAHALDGIINSFTIPAFNLLIAWDKPPGSSKVALRTKQGRLTKFGNMVAYLKGLKILGTENKSGVFPRRYGNAYAFPIRINKLRQHKDSLGEIIKKGKALNKHTKKYVRYLRIAAESTKKKFVRLDQSDFNLDRFQTVLSRLTRWADIGALERDYKLGRPGIVTFRIKKTNLTKSLISRIRKEWEAWARTKQNDFSRQEQVLKSVSHEKRLKLIHKAFLCKEPPVVRSKFARKRPADRVPQWLK